MAVIHVMPCNAGHAGSFCEGSLDLCIICGGSDKDWMPGERQGLVGGGLVGYLRRATVSNDGLVLVRDSNRLLARGLYLYRNRYIRPCAASPVARVGVVRA
jgi:hypothetical protein